MSKGLESLNSLTPTIYGDAITAQLNTSLRSFAHLETPEGQAYLEERRKKREAARQARIKANPPAIQIEALGWESEGVVVTCATCGNTLERDSSVLSYETIKELAEAHTCE